MVKQTPQSSSPSERSDSSKYKGVRKRKWGKWVSEIRLPNSRERIWLGSYDSAEKAARAFDAALFCLRGRNAKFNFPDSPPDIDGGRHLTPSEIQAAAARFANSAAASSPSAGPRSHSDSELHMDRSPSPSASEGTVHMDSDPSLDVLDGSIWDLVADNNNAAINYNYNYNYSYDNVNYHNDSSSNNNNMMDTVPGSGEYPTEYGIFPGFDDLSSDFYAPTLPPVDHGEENFDGLINQSSFLWNF